MLCGNGTMVNTQIYYFLFIIFLHFYFFLIKFNYKNKALPMEYNPFMPGLEVKFAIEEAKKLNANVEYLDYEIDVLTKNKLYHETRYSIFKTLMSMIRMKSTYAREFLDFYTQITNYGHKKFIESSCDQYFINWY